MVRRLVPPLPPSKPGVVPSTPPCSDFLMNPIAVRKVVVAVGRSCNRSEGVRIADGWDQDVVPVESCQ